jgi:pimeloyl-ACP methyl ester carboxylesterase
MSTYVLVHGAWHTGAELEPVAAVIRAAGHQVFTPTIRGNRPGDAKTTGLDLAIQSIVDYLAENNLKDVILLGHSYGGMIITGVADRAGERIRRLVYWNAFVPNNGESLNDMVPPIYLGLFDAIAAERGGWHRPARIWTPSRTPALIQTARSLQPGTNSRRTHFRKATHPHSRAC